MYKKDTVVLLVLGALMLLCSCAKEGPTGPTGPSGPSFTGSITGYVKLYDQYGSPVLTDLNYITLTINGTAYVPITTTISQLPAGYYNFSNVTTGNYTIVATDTSANVLFAATQVANIDFVAGTLEKDIKMSAIPDTFVTSLSAFESSSSLTDSLVLTVSPDTRVRNAIVFVNATLAATGYLLRYIVPIPANTTTVSYQVPRQDLLNAGILSGQEAYFVGYSYVVNDASVYENPLTGENVYNAVGNKVLVDSALVP